MSSYALHSHLRWRTQSRLGQERRLNDGNNNGQLRIATPPRVVHAKPPGPIYFLPVFTLITITSHESVMVITIHS